MIAGTTSSFTVAENYDITRALGTFTATDAKDGRTVHPQWSLSGRDGGDFVIDRSSGTHLPSETRRTTTGPQTRIGTTSTR